MYSNHQLRFRDVVNDINETLIGISPYPRLMPNNAGYLPYAARHSYHYSDGGGSRAASSASSSRPMHAPPVRSTASSAPLRSLDGTLPSSIGGNVKVVVRVRAFLPRGMLLIILDQ